MLIKFYDIDCILKNVIEIKSKTNQIISYNTLSFNHNMYIDGNKISKRCSHRVVYKCPNCSNTCVIRLSTLADKLKRGYQGCKYCYHDTFHQDNIPNMRLYVDKEYFKKELTTDEFERIKDKIVSIQHKFTVDELEYIPIKQVGKTISSLFYDTKRDVYEEGTHIDCRCEQCLTIFTIQHLFELKNQYKILCNDCKRRKTLQFGVYKNVIYKNKFEYKFIKLCLDTFPPITIVNREEKLFIPFINKYVQVLHKKFKKKCGVKDDDIFVIYSDEMKEQFNIIKKLQN